MTKPYASLEQIEHNHKITQETDHAFLYLLQGGLLLALKEQGRLNEMQYRQAQDCLDQQHRKWVKKCSRKGSCHDSGGQLLPGFHG
ncbi:hypothetical protein [Pseudoflavonifractor phocaeensis]|uniref:hypothetical protein n=1 Tax=Pseudoflavonifractor phocaeensis TaxID=1870988 RepID=UPI00195EF38B|nr:hypothetical protein [Pseudoflavonifractor phocaeensis]MBM6926447.1 hypothetical protein [Pseudoflavonifractor phocaeensis]